MPNAAPAPASPPPLPPSLRFGGDGRYTLEAAERRLLADGQPLPLVGRAFDLLAALASQPGHLYTKSQLLDIVWPGLVVEEANLHVQVSQLRKLLGSETIDTVPGRGYRFAARVHAAATAPGEAPAPVAARPAAPPAATPRLIGRDADLAALIELLATSSCLTLVGGPGVGKTSLARLAAAGWQGQALWVDLAPLTDGAQVTGAVARAFGVPLPEGDTPTHLQEALANLLPPSAERLLVLDNAEHLIEACAALVGALQMLPALRLLVTSQLPLAVSGEQVQRLDPLTLAPVTQADLGDGAAALLAARIAAADHRFRVTPETLPLLQVIARQLDGLPLALVMAAARVPTLGLQGVHDALAERFALLTHGRRDATPRHRSLHQALDWSYGLLSADEQRLLRALGVLAGEFTLELAVALLAAGQPTTRWALIDGLDALADRSLLAVSAGEPPHYRLLETVRAYALERLEAAGEDEAVRRRHAQALAPWLEQARDQHPAIPARDDDMANAREAIAWASTCELETAVRIALAAFDLAAFGVWRTEAGQWLAGLAPQMHAAAGAALPARLRTLWWHNLTRIYIITADARAEATAHHTVELARELDDPDLLRSTAMGWMRSQAEPGPRLDEACALLRSLTGEGWNLTSLVRLRVAGALGMAALLRKDHDALLQCRLEEARLAAGLGDHSAAVTARSNIVYALVLGGRPAEAAACGQALLAELDAAGEGQRNGNMPWVLEGLILALLATARLDDALALLPRALAADRRFGVRVSHNDLPKFALARGDPASAARLVGHVEVTSGVLVRNDREALDAVRQQVVVALGEAAAQALIVQGRALSQDEATALVCTPH
ncbi:MAG: winged helix-turn-helix domain-containing protein [Proteobacteria bacterium]|nr:winged helix-turn-helix domain-containing protein [Pseudomonadota bacterium]